MIEIGGSPDGTLAVDVEGADDDPLLGSADGVPTDSVGNETGIEDAVLVVIDVGA